MELPRAATPVISGTSTAAPHVAGCVGLVRSRFPDMSAAEVFRLVQSTAKPLTPVLRETAVQTSEGLRDRHGSPTRVPALLRCEVAIRSAERVSTPASEFSLGAGPKASPTKTQALVIENKSTEPKTWTS